MTIPSSSPQAKTSISAIILIIIMIAASALNTSMVSLFFGYAQEEDATQQQKTSEPRLRDSTLQLELVADGLRHPTSMDFIDREGHMIILQKDDGKALLVSTTNDSNNSGENNDNHLPKVGVLNIKVNNASERGLLGLATFPPTIGNKIVDNNNDNKTYVFLYFTESNNNTEKAEPAISNRVFRYEWDAEDKELTRPVLILDLPAEPGPNHDGGKLVFAKDEEGNTNHQNNNLYHLYSVIGDLNREGTLQNFKNGPPPDDTSVILRVNPDGSPVQGNPFLDISKNNNNSSYANLDKVFAYGIRNSFGLAVDPLTGTLWMTENGPDRYDEINVVKPGFNSGWKQVKGPIEKSGKSTDDLVHLPGSHYADPVFSWLAPVGITDIEFLNSTKLGSKYANNIFVGDINNGNLYFFTVNKNRTGITFEDNSNSGVMDLIADNPGEVSKITFGTGFKGGITDIETGPDGYLYILTFDGKLYRIVPGSQ